MAEEGVSFALSFITKSPKTGLIYIGDPKAHYLLVWRDQPSLQQIQKVKLTKKPFSVTFARDYYLLIVG